MPTPDKYGTQSAIALLRQQIDYGGFYDLKKLSFKTILSAQYLGAMNPTAGSFFVIDRLQRHFSTFATLMPENEVLTSIYGAILSGHLATFPLEVSGFDAVTGACTMADACVSATLALHKEVADSFLPTAIKFHYQFNLRELSAVFQGLCSSNAEYYTSPMHLVRLWRHETYRVYADRLVDVPDVELYEEMAARVTKNYFGDMPEAELLATPLVYANFALSSTGDEKVYFSIDSFEKLKGILEAKLTDYNSANARMDLVLFAQVTRPSAPRAPPPRTPLRHACSVEPLLSVCASRRWST
jgi:dynein heavy chain